jgi:hypothetical protein
VQYPIEARAESRFECEHVVVEALDRSTQRFLSDVGIVLGTGPGTCLLVLP